MSINSVRIESILIYSRKIIYFIFYKCESLRKRVPYKSGPLCIKYVCKYLLNTDQIINQIWIVGGFVIDLHWKVPMKGKLIFLSSRFENLHPPIFLIIHEYKLSFHQKNLILSHVSNVTSIENIFITKHNPILLLLSIYPYQQLIM